MLKELVRQKVDELLAEKAEAERKAAELEREKELERSRRLEELVGELRESWGDEFLAALGYEFFESNWERGIAFDFARTRFLSQEPPPD